MRTKLVILGSVGLTLILGLLLRTAWSDPIAQPLAGYQAAPTRAATLQSGWQYARNAASTGYVDTDDDAVEPNAMTWQNTGDYFVIPYEWNTISLSFFGYGDGTDDGDANGGSFDCNVYVAEPYASWEQVGSFTGAIGELELTHFPAGTPTVATGTAINAGSVDPNQSYKWAEGPFTDNLSDADAWPTTVNLSGRTNGTGRMNFNPLGTRVLIVRFDNIASLTRVYAVVKGR